MTEYFIRDNQLEKNEIWKYGIFSNKNEAIDILGYCLMKQVDEGNGGFDFKSEQQKEKELLFVNGKPSLKTYRYLINYFDYSIVELTNEKY